MKFSEFDLVILLKDDLHSRLNKGDRGVIAAIYVTPNEAYEVAFTNENSETIAQKAFLPEELEKVITL